MDPWIVVEVAAPLSPAATAAVAALLMVVAGTGKHRLTWERRADSRWHRWLRRHLLR